MLKLGFSLSSLLGGTSGPALSLNFLSGTLDSRITFSRGSNATLTDSTGKVTYAPANLLTYSQDFDNAAWIKTAATVTANSAIAPDGTTTADKLVEALDASPTLHIASRSSAVTIGVPHTVSVYAKAAERAQLAIQLGNLVSYFNLSNGTVVSGAGTIVDAGNGWYRCVLAIASPPNSTCAFYPAVAGSATYTGNGTSGIFIWGAQLEAVTYQTTPGTYNGTTASAYYGPRFDYDPVTLAPKGLLIEEARTNLVTYSSNWANVAWAKTNITVTAAATASPDGTTNGQKLEATATAATALNSTPVAVAATSATYSVYVKQGTGPTTANTFFLRNNTTATLLVGGTLNFATGVFSYIIGSTGATVTNAGNGWWRIQLTATTGITSGDALHGYVGWSGAVATAGDFLYAYGAQLEAGSFATSYIPTVASQVTRSADVATMTGTNFSSWYNQTAGTFVVSADTLYSNASDLATIRSVFTADNGTTSNLHRIYQYANIYGANTIAGGVNQSDISLSSIVVNTPAKLAYAYAVNDFSAARDGILGTPDTSGSLPSPTQLSFGARFPVNGHIQTITYYNTRLPNTQLQALTAPSTVSNLSLDFMNRTYSVGY